MSQRHNNLLINETSPYLLQHAHNPVDWHPYNPAALKLAQQQNKPIFLSIGYSACHWCHVMAHECFEDDEVAQLLNQSFISIKVDREERPDIDDIYMAAVQAMTGSGGWPMSAFLTPEGEPFYAGTYFPKQDKYGQPGFITLIRKLSDYWQRHQEEVKSRSQDLVALLKKQIEQSATPVALAKDMLRHAIAELEAQFDPHQGGFGPAPKFPAAMSLDLYIDSLNLQNNTKIQQHLQLSLRKMAQGGMYDQVGGGFHRYSTDEKWLVPHFEKMLYDNALLAKTYFDASQLLDTDFNGRIACEICDYVLKEMRHKCGAFFSSTDADSDGIEGQFFLWSQAEVAAVLGPKNGADFCQLYGIEAEPAGKVQFDGGTPPHQWFQGRIPHLTRNIEQQLSALSLNQNQLDQWRLKLWQARAQRSPPFRDEKALASWNALMSSAFTTAFRITGKTQYYQAAKQNLHFICSDMQQQGRLHATWKDGISRHAGTLEDYANVAQALLDLHRIEGGPERLQQAQSLADSVIQHFTDPKGHTFFYTADDAEPLIIRSKNLFDNAVPGGNSTMAGVLVRLGVLLARPDYIQRAEGIFHENSAAMMSASRGFSKMVREYVALTAGSQEMILLNADATLKQLAIKSLKPTEFFLTEKDHTLALLKDKITQNQQTALYLCKAGQCALPIFGSDDIRDYLLKRLGQEKESLLQKLRDAGIEP